MSSLRRRNTGATDTFRSDLRLARIHLARCSGSDSDRNARRKVGLIGDDHPFTDLKPLSDQRRAVPISTSMTVTGWASTVELPLIT